MARDVSDVMHRKRGMRFEKSQSWILASEEDGCLSELAEALRQVSHMMVVVGGDGKVSIERLCISLLMSKNLLTQR